MRPAIHGGSLQRSWRQHSHAERRGLSAEFLSNVRTSKSQRGPLSSFISAKLTTLDQDSLLVAVATAVGSSSAGVALGSSTDVAIACMPFVFPPWLAHSREPDSTASNDTGSGNVAQEMSARTLLLQHSMMLSCCAHALSSALQLALNDVVSGLMGCGVATLGMQAAAPNGRQILPRYIVLTFCNGVMQVLLSTDPAFAQRLLAGLGSRSLLLKVGAVASVASPVLMFTTLAIAWRLHSELRAFALAAPFLPESLGGPVHVRGEDGAPSVLGAWQPYVGEPHHLSTENGKDKDKDTGCASSRAT